MIGLHDTRQIGGDQIIELPNETRRILLLVLVLLRAFTHNPNSKTIIKYELSQDGFCSDGDMVHRHDIVLETHGAKAGHKEKPEDPEPGSNNCFRSLTRLKQAKGNYMSSVRGDGRGIGAHTKSLLIARGAAN
jgi:hypothetical protein